MIAQRQLSEPWVAEGIVIFLGLLPIYRYFRSLLLDPEVSISLSVMSLTGGFLIYRYVVMPIWRWVVESLSKD